MSEIFHGDSFEILRTLENDSVDLLCTDPPYGYSFMGKAWDKALPDIGIFKECLRVLKPGAFAFVMSAPRSDVCSRMAILLEETGFNIAFTPIYWTYASGFPKAMNIGKMVDKRNGRDPDQFRDFAAHYATQRALKGLTHSAICAAGGFFENVNHGGASVNWEKGHNVPTLDQWLVLQPLLGLSGDFSALIEREESERQVVGKYKSDMGGLGGERIGEKGGNITTHATDAAKALDGSYGGFQPKPAVEVVIVAMKPLSEKTYVDQALKNGKGITWLDDCRVPIGEETVPRLNKAYERKGGLNFGDGDDGRLGTITGHESAGRFPANLLVSDDVLNDGVERKSGKAPSGGLVRRLDTERTTYNRSDFAGQDAGALYGDSGSYSRFFSLDAWAQTLPFLAVPKASKREKNEGLEGLEERQVTGGGGGVGDYLDDVNSASGKYGSEKAPAKNFHPTVKPLKLMSYLITLGSRPGDVVLDPFLGSGTTAIAAKQLGRQIIGIEREEEYVNIAQARLQAIVPSLI